MTPAPNANYVLTKTDFKYFLDCPREFWLRHHHPEAILEPIGSHAQYLIRQGYEVERIARDVLRAKSGASTLVPQHTVTHENLLARFDVFREKTDGSCEIYEVKSSKHIPRTETAKAKKEKRELNLYDLGFQVYVARLAGLDVTAAYLVTINGEYQRGEELELDSAIHFEDVTGEIDLIQSEVKTLADEALALVASDPGPGFENLCGRKLKCPYFAFARPDLPKITIYDIPGLRGERLEKLIATGALAVTDLTDADLTPKQLEYVEEAKNPPAREIKQDEIRELIDALVYPLYFLDYETVNPAIPKFAGMYSYEQITFQFSLHVLREKGGELLHHEFLSGGNGDVQRGLIGALRDAIGDTGSILSWNKSFEINQNRLLARLYPEHSDFLESLNERMFDLGLPFQKGLFSDPAIAGWSIKNVLPVLVPGMNYDALEIAGGAAASAIWYMDVFLGSEEKDRRMRELREYCKQDTLAMVRILEKLQQLLDE